MARFCPPTASSDLRVAVTVDGLISAVDQRRRIRDGVVRPRGGLNVLDRGVGPEAARREMESAPDQVFSLRLDFFAGR